MTALASPRTLAAPNPRGARGVGRVCFLCRSNTAGPNEAANARRSAAGTKTGGARISDGRARPSRKMSRLDWHNSYDKDDKNPSRVKLEWKGVYLTRRRRADANHSASVSYVDYVEDLRFLSKDELTTRGASKLYGPGPDAQAEALAQGEYELELLKNPTLDRLCEVKEDGSFRHVRKKFNKKLKNGRVALTPKLNSEATGAMKHLNITIAAKAAWDYESVELIASLDDEDNFLQNKIRDALQRSVG